MPRIAELIRQEGRLILSLRHGPVPAGRPMFDVRADETIRPGESCDLVPILIVNSESVQPAQSNAGVTWTYLAFDKR